MFKNFPQGIVTVVGDVIVDKYLVGSVSRISPEAPVPVLLHEREFIVPGGAANVAVNAAAMGAQVCLIGLLGLDEAAEKLRGNLAGYARLDIAGLVEDPTRPTITKTRVVAGRQQLVRIDSELVNSPTIGILERLIESAVHAVLRSRVVVLSDYAKGALSETVTAAILSAAHSRDIPVIVDPKRRDFQAYRGATLLKPNAQELEQATGLRTDTDEAVCLAAETASDQFGGDVLVTRSEKGMTLWRRGFGAAHFPTENVAVSDVSGAGDTSLAALAVWIASGYEIEDAVRIANKAAGIAVSKLGTSVVTREDIERSVEYSESSMSGQGRLVSLARAKEIVSLWRRHSEKIVFTNGCFDLLHPGHVRLLDLAAAEGERLIVALNSDASVRRLKGPSRPVQDEEARARVIGSLRTVDLVIIFHEDTPLKAIEKLAPDVLVKGADYTENQVVGGEHVKSYGGRIVLVPIVPDRSTSALVKKVRS